MELENGKIKVQDKETAKKILARLFELGFQWANGGTALKHLDVHSYYFYVKECEVNALPRDAMIITKADTSTGYKKHPNKEYTLDELMGKPKDEAQDLMNLINKIENE